MRGNLVLSVCVSMLAAVVCAAGEPVWTHDYSAARRQAETGGKILFLSVHAVWCGPCQAMHRTTFRDQRVAQRLNESCVCLALDGDADAGLIGKLPVKVYPTEIFAAADGRILEVVEGFADAQRLLSALERAQKLAKTQPDALATRRDPTETTQRPAPTVASTKPKPAVEQPVQPEPTRPAPTVRSPAQVAVQSTPVDSSRSADNSPKVNELPCLGGFCPVTMKERAELVRGDTRFTASYRGEKFWFRSPREKTLFERDPTQYLPAESGRCVVTWREKQQWRTGSIAFPAMFSDQLFLFPNSDLRDKFLRDPERYVDRSGRAYR